MSKFLAPIHYWLYGKVAVMEDIEELILSSINHPEIFAKANQLYNQFGAPIGDRPLESVIDQGNIHGWLQSKITAVETRQAFLLDFAMTVISKDHVLSLANACYSQEGKELGTYRNDNKLKSPAELFKALHDVLLEGMPCDRVAVVTHSSNDSHEWDVAACVHETYWNQNQLKVSDYYKLRASFSKSFIEAANPDFTYKFHYDNGQKHKIVRATHF